MSAKIFYICHSLHEISRDFGDGVHPPAYINVCEVCEKSGKVQRGPYKWSKIEIVNKEDKLKTIIWEDSDESSHLYFIPSLMHE